MDAILRNVVDLEPILQIDCRALRENVRHVRATVGADVTMYAVVKANAYGHGIDVVAPAVRDLTDGFVVANLREAATVRALPGLADSTVIVLQAIDPLLQTPATLDAAVASGFTLTPGSLAGLRAIAAAATRVGRVAPIQVHVDTGLRRCGVDVATGHLIAQETLTHRSLRLAHLSTHCAYQQDGDHSFNWKQLHDFVSFARQWKAQVPKLLTHAAASGLALLCPEMRLDAVRIGAAMYGIDPTGAHDPTRPLRPAMTLTAPVVAVREVAAGEGVGYSHSHVATRAGRVAILPVGYFDGYLRTASNRGTVMLHGIACPTIGTVSMDLLIVDVSHCPAASIGDIATVLDAEPTSPASIYGLARAAQTIAYEIVSRMGTRARRVVIAATDPLPIANSEFAVEPIRRPSTGKLRPLVSIKVRERATTTSAAS